VTAEKPRLAFVSPVFLFPRNTGGRIRTSNILRGLKGGSFDITLLSPATARLREQWGADLELLCDRFVQWDAGRPKSRWARAADLLDELPINVVADRRRQGIDQVSATLASNAFSVVVFDFVHAAVLRPERVNAATVCFTHNVEAEIFQRHAQRARNPVMRRIWSSQHAKMARFEGDALRRFDAVIAVSERDADGFRSRYGLATASTIPTGVDLDYFSWQEPALPSATAAPTVVFIGSMDWDANVDGVQHFLSEVWPRVLEKVPQAQFTVVGRNPPHSLIRQAASVRGVTLTGLVEDVRPYVRAAQVSVIPLRVGGGTRIKAFEAMAMGCPVVSTSIGVEGLDVVPDVHYLNKDDAAAQAQGIVELLSDTGLRSRLSRQARVLVEGKFGHAVAARAFERICLSALEARRGSGVMRRSDAPC